MYTDLRGRCAIVATSDDGDPIFEIRLGALIPEEIWKMGIEAVRVGERVLRNPTPDETVREESDAGENIAFADCTVWIADGIRWVQAQWDYREYPEINRISWTLHSRPQPARPPIPG